MISSFFTVWQRFWHEPVRAERLAITRIFLGLALLSDQLIQYWPHFAACYGPEGVAPAGVHDQWLLKNWRWTILLFNTDDLAVVAVCFWLRVAVTVAFVLGWHTRIASVLLWFSTLCFVNRNPALQSFAEHVLMNGLFLMMMAPCGQALSLDRRRQIKRQADAAAATPPTTPAWPVRMVQIQVCMIYLSTGLAKLFRDFDGSNWFEGTWWDGTSLHYVLNDTTMGHWSYARFPVPLWLTALATYVSVWWEILFTPLVMFRLTRKWTLWFGVLFHLGIFVVIEIGWFSFYTLALYGVWIPGEFWDRVLRRRSSTTDYGQFRE
jgi:uncharacterized membrane protein YphA (DoxX/SURF4 family)